MRIDNVLSPQNNHINSSTKSVSDPIEPNNFNQVLSSAIKLPELNASDTKLDGANIPHWVLDEYGYDPENPRKPNMREMMEALSGKAISDLYDEPTSTWQKISMQASELLYGVIGSGHDTRDWERIGLSTENFIVACRKETGDMLQPIVDIISETDENGDIVEQHAVVKDKNGTSLRDLHGTNQIVTEILLNFGANDASIPKDLRSQVVEEVFDQDVLSALIDFKRNLELASVTSQTRTRTNGDSTTAESQIVAEDLWGFGTKLSSVNTNTILKLNED